MMTMIGFGVVLAAFAAGIWVAASMKEGVVDVGELGDEPGRDELFEFRQRARQSNGHTLVYLGVFAVLAIKFISWLSMPPYAHMYGRGANGFTPRRFVHMETVYLLGLVCLVAFALPIALRLLTRGYRVNVREARVVRDHMHWVADADGLKGGVALSERGEGSGDLSEAVAPGGLRPIDDKASAPEPPVR